MGSNNSQLDTPLSERRRNSTYAEMVREQRRNGPGDEHRQAEHYRAADALRCGDGMAEAEVELVRDEIQVEQSCRSQGSRSSPARVERP